MFPSCFKRLSSTRLKLSTTTQSNSATTTTTANTTGTANAHAATTAKVTVMVTTTTAATSPMTTGTATTKGTLTTTDITVEVLWEAALAAKPTAAIVYVHIYLLVPVTWRPGPRHVTMATTELYWPFILLVSEFSEQTNINFLKSLVAFFLLVRDFTCTVNPDVFIVLNRLKATDYLHMRVYLSVTVYSLVELFICELNCPYTDFICLYVSLSAL